MSATVVAPNLVRHQLWVQVGPCALTPTLTLPEEPRGLVLVANGSGDRAYQRANSAITTALRDASFATIEADLLTREEAVEDAERPTFRFDVSFIAGRIAAVLAATTRVPALRTLELGVLAAGPCAAAALIAAAERPTLIQSMVCRAPRLEFAGGALAHVHAPVLLLLGERDVAHRARCHAAMKLLPPRSRLETVQGAHHLLDRPEDACRVASLTVGWFGDTLTSRWVIAGRWTPPVLELSQRPV